MVLVVAMLVAGLLMAQPLDSAAKNIESGSLRGLAGWSPPRSRR